MFYSLSENGTCMLTTSALLSEDTKLIPGCVLCVCSCLCLFYPYKSMNWQTCRDECVRIWLFCACVYAFMLDCCMYVWMYMCGVCVGAERNSRDRERGSMLAVPDQQRPVQHRSRSVSPHREDSCRARSRPAYVPMQRLGIHTVPESTGELSVESVLFCI